MTTGQPTATTRRPASSVATHPLSLAIELDGLSKGTKLSQLEPADWKRWSRHLARRKQPATLAQITRTSGIEALSWGWNAGDDDGETRDLLRLLQQKLLAGKPRDNDLAEIASTWLKEAASRPASPALGIESLAWSHALALLVAELPQRWWCNLAEQLLDIAHASTAICGELAPLAQQLLAGELPLTLARSFPEIAACAALAKASRNVLSDGVMDLLDDGLPRSEHLSIARPLLACWTRASVLGESLKKGILRSGAQDQFRNFVRHSISLSRPDGSQMLSPQGTKLPDKFLDAALANVDDNAASVTAEALFFGQSPPLNGKRKLMLPSAVHSEWSELAVLRANWSKNSPALAINYGSGQIECELVSQQRVLWSGACDPQVELEGQPAAKPDRWEEVCWFTDDDVHYIELEAELGAGWKTQRQFLLVRTDAILLIADAIIGPSSAEIDYQCVWPTLPSLSFVPSDETCEGSLQTGGRRVANLLPLALPEWRSDGRRSGNVTATSDGVRYHVARRAQRLYVPLLVDLEPWRIKRELTWRQLTVGHNLVPQPPEVAVGYRVQLYKQQWLIYRALAERASRTVLGQNIYSEFVCARFNRGGDADTLIEIE
jgi:hypothetical protein